MMTSIFPPYRRWYKFGLKSPVILWKRLHNQHAWLSPRREIRYGLQRWRRGWSDRDVWGFDHYLSRVIEEGVAYMREIAHGHPNEITFLEWCKILQEIEEGMRAARTITDLPVGVAEEYDRLKAAHDLAMNHLKRWWFDLWD